MPRVPPKPPVYRRKRVYNPSTRGVVPYGYDPWRYGWKKVSPDGLYNNFTAPASNLYDNRAAIPPAPKQPGPGSAAVIRQLQSNAAKIERANRRAYQNAFQPIKSEVQHIRQLVESRLLGIKEEGHQDDIFQPGMFKEERLSKSEKRQIKKARKAHTKQAKKSGRTAKSTDAKTVAEGQAFVEKDAGSSSTAVQPTGGIRHTRKSLARAAHVAKGKEKGQL